MNYIISKHSSKQVYNYHPQTKDELKKLINKLIEERGLEANLNDIDTSAITDMSSLFMFSNFNGDISKWDVSKVKNMTEMFCWSTFNRDISKWDVSSVKYMGSMFTNSEFTGKNGDISEWNVSNVTNMFYMFAYSPLQNNPPIWYKQ